MITKVFFGLTRLANELVKEFHPDLIANLHDVIRTKVLDKIYRRKGLKVFKINKGKEEKEHLTDIWNLHKTQLKKTVERYADVFREMGFKVELSHQLRPSSTIKSLIGSEFPGSIVKEECEPYEYTIQDTGEIITLSHRYVYRAEELTSSKVYSVPGNLSMAD